MCRHAVSVFACSYHMKVFLIEGCKISMPDVNAVAPGVVTPRGARIQVVLS